MEYVPGGDLRRQLRSKHKFSEEEARFYAAEVLIAMECLHANNFVYRDLKPENVLLDAEGHIKLSDFGLSKEDIVNGKKSYTICGTMDYIAPETLVKDGHNKSVDWWSLVLSPLILGNIDI
jgi:serine/threonine protein kinase